MTPVFELIRKYNIAAPRYTSYPTVPYWDNSPDETQWKDAVQFSFSKENQRHGLSLYIHLPYCESLCTYCGCNTRITVNHKVEEPYIGAVMNEWAQYLALLGETPRIRELHLGGGTPTFFSPEHLSMLVEGILSSAMIMPDASLSFEAHPNSTTEAHLQVLYDHGFRRISLGIQDFDPEVQHIVNRVQSVEQVQQVTEAARRIGYTSINYDLIYGLPLQTRQSIINTMEQMRLLQPDRIAFYSYAHVPWIKPGQRRFTEADLPDDEVKRDLYETGRVLLRDMGYHDIGMDHFALPHDELYIAAENGLLHRNFMGYTTQHTGLVIGLGASAISDTMYAYAQNEKTVETYMERVAEQHLPIFRGHLLNCEDVIMRRHILNLMCRYGTSWEHGWEYCTAMEGAMERLYLLEADGLVRISPRRITVTPMGRAFLRNICLCFDARYWRKQPATVLFSKSI